LCFQAIFLACALLAIALGPSAASAATCEKWAGKVVSLQGTVDAKVAGGTQWQPAKLNDTYCPGDMLRTGRRSRAEVALQNHPLLRLDENSTITFAGMKDERTSLIDMLSGAALFFSRVTRNLEVRTATVNAGVEGTEFFIRVEEGKTSLSIFEGKVLASNEAGSLAVTTGQSAVAEKGKAPVPAVVVRPRDAVRWALYYPPVIYARPVDYENIPDADLRDRMQKSVDAYWKGDLAGAFSAIEGAPKDVSDPRFLTYRASLLLTVGRIDEAAKDIEQALSLDPKNSHAFALQSIIAVAQNEKGKALGLAQKAVEADPKSPTARIALSYAQQAGFNLQEALGSTNEAVKLGPENALAWARLAELRQSFGELGESLDAAKKAAALSPDLSKTQTVLGFAYLTRVNTQEAKKVFGKAIGLDQADPLPRLGLGLAKIREGSLEEGRRDLEIAIALDPDNGLLRSYLGKAYFEEKRDNLAKGQYDMAKSLDPIDPTPYFYDAIRKQTVNQPVEALHDLQKAIELNDNRAVYRSRLLLDQDLAARSASLARIYSDLGFQQLSLVEGWKSVNIDPSNYSAHRFLADSYAALPRHEIARVSELLQSQLLQPLNITPLQPHLSESNLFVLEGAGPASLSFNEFNPLFLRNRFALQASGIVGEDSTMGEEVTVSGLYNKVSFSLGQFHHETDGFRTNNDRDDDIYNVFLQASLTPITSLQAEFRYREFEYGDLSLNFFPDDFLESFRNDDEIKSVRMGFHHAFSPGSDLIGNFMYQEKDLFFGLTFEDPEFFFLSRAGTVTEEEAKSAELQYLFNSKHINVTIGAGYFDIEADDLSSFEDFDTSTTPPTPLGGFSDLQQSDIRHTNAYLYSNIKFRKNVIFTIGVSGDFFDGENILGAGNIKEDRFNPKFGITWNPFVSTTVRAAAFRTLKRTLATDQTLEPTQVAGFNQFFDDASATKAWRYGVAVDQKITKNIYGGVEYSQRDLEVPFFDFPDPFDPTISVLKYVDWEERLARAYLYWTPHEWLALRAEYQYEELDRDQEFVAGAKEVETHRVPFGASFFHPCGLSANVQTTYYDQQGDFERLDTPPGVFLSGDDQFWLVDAAIGYRLPKRYGIITVGAKNLFDESFSYFDSDPANPAIQPERLFFARITLSL
jgi:tetratricopeptide (TPR) repeat protein/opacity protein-like surface antigen